MAVKIRITRFYGYHLLNTVLPVSQTFEKFSSGSIANLQSLESSALQFLFHFCRTGCMCSSCLLGGGAASHAAIPELLGVTACCPAIDGAVLQCVVFQA